MDILSSIIKFFFGSKADKDRKEIEPYVEKIKAIYPTIQALDNDGLRARSAALRADIAAFIQPEEDRIVALKVELEKDGVSLNDKERLSKEVDSLVEEIDKKIEIKLDEILPEAFAIMKDTARRFAEAETVEIPVEEMLPLEELDADPVVEIELTVEDTSEETAETPADAE